MSDDASVFAIDANPMYRDWTKRTWDLPYKNADEVRAWLSAAHISLQDFVKSPIYRYNVEKLPWLKELKPAGAPIAG